MKRLDKLTIQLTGFDCIKQGFPTCGKRDIFLNAKTSLYRSFDTRNGNNANKQGMVIMQMFKFHGT